MKNQEIKADMLLLLTAIIWGFAFVAQRIGAQYVGAFTFNGIRFAIGSISLIPLILYFNRKSKESTEKVDTEKQKISVGAWQGGAIAGCALFMAASLQQIGLSYTSVGKAAFITGLYMVIVPLLGILLKQHVNISTWMGVALAVVGLYFLSITENFSISKGDLIELVGAVFWSIHILTIDHFVKKVDALKLSFVQFITCSILSMIVALIFEKITINGLTQAIIPILYGGICSVGIAYTLQVVGQKHAKPSHAAIILSLEAVFAAIGGLLILHENLGGRGYLGCGLMLSGML
ncbi:MAG: drug/metabolite transporter (DMT)-like permease, partial [Clostridium sp.]